MLLTNPSSRRSRCYAPFARLIGNVRVKSMSFDAFIRNHYVRACDLQRQIDDRDDNKIKRMLASGNHDKDIVKHWMRGYALFQGITAHDREKIAKRYLAFMASADTPSSIADGMVLESIYSKLFTALFLEVRRSWMSATSKLLWCKYPDQIVIYDSFVERALIVMQCLDGDLVAFARIGVAPKVKHKTDIAAAVEHYMNYQRVVRHILTQHSKILNDLRQKHSEPYPHDIRIVDKLLWMIGNPKYDLTDHKEDGPTIRSN